MVGVGGVKGAIKGRLKGKIEPQYDPLDILKEETKPSYDPLRLDTPKAKVIEPVKAKIVPAESIKLDEVKPVEPPIVEPPPAEIVQPGATSGGKQPVGGRNSDAVNQEMRDLNAKVMAGDKQPLGAGEEYWPSSDEAKFAFSEMKSQLEAGAPRGVNEIGGETFAWGTSYPQWFRDISKKHNLTAKETTSFINKYFLGTELVPRTFKGELTNRQGAIYDDIIKAAKRRQNRMPESKTKLTPSEMKVKDALKKFLLARLQQRRALANQKQPLQPET